MRAPQIKPGFREARYYRESIPVRNYDVIHVAGLHGAINLIVINKQCSELL